MKIMTWLGILFGLVGLHTQGADLPWLTDLQKAQAQAKAEKKFVLLFFHGSDWCPTCAEMQSQVFRSPEFTRYARESLVLVDVDFPEKAKLSADQKRINLELKSKFNVGKDWDDGYPTLVLLNDAGDTLFQEMGYSGGGPGETIPKLQRHTKSNSPAVGAVFKDLSIEQFAAMAGDSRNVILDVRTPREFQAGHIAGAVNIDVNAADFEEKAGALDKTKTYLVHCASGVRSVKACEKLSKLSFLKLYNLPGGFRAWESAGKPVQK